MCKCGKLKIWHFWHMSYIRRSVCIFKPPSPTPPHIIPFTPSSNLQYHISPSPNPSLLPSYLNLLYHQPPTTTIILNLYYYLIFNITSILSSSFYLFQLPYNLIINIILSIIHPYIIIIITFISHIQNQIAYSKFTYSKILW